MNSKKQSYISDHKLVIIAGIAYIITVIIIVASNWLTGSHVFDIHLTVSRYIGLQVWTSVMYFITALGMCTLLVIYVIKSRTNILQKITYFLITLGVMGCAVFPSASARSKLSTTIHGYFSKELFICVTISVALMLIFNKNIKKRIFAALSLVFSLAFIYCYANEVPVFMDSLFIWENIFIFILLAELHLEEPLIQTQKQA